MSITLGGSSPAVTFPDSTTQSTAGLTAINPVITSGSLTFPNGSTQNQGSGMGSGGQTWQNLTGSRATSTTYTNSTGYPIMLLITLNGASGSNGNRTIALYINGSLVYFNAYYTTTGNNTLCGIIPVPNGATYSCDGAGSGVTESLATWWELR